MSAFSEYLTRCRKASDLSQAQVAIKVRERVGEEVAGWYINKIERGRLYHPAVNRLEAICQAVGADFREALRLGEYPGYTDSEIKDELPVFLKARLANLKDNELQNLDRLWPAIEDLVRRASEPASG